MKLFLSLEHLEAILGFFIGPISILLCLRETEGPSQGDSQLGKQSEHRTFIDEVHCLVWSWSLVSKTITIVTSNTTDHRSHNKYNNIEKL